MYVDIIFNIDFEIPRGSNNIEIVYADTLSNLLSGNYLYNNYYSFPISEYTINNTSGINYIGFIANSNGLNSDAIKDSPPIIVDFIFLPVKKSRITKSTNLLILISS